MFAELCALPRVCVYLDGEIVEQSTTSGAAADSVRIDVCFDQIPVSVDVDGECTVVRTRSTADPQGAEANRKDHQFTYRVDSVVTAMGFVQPSEDAISGDLPVLRVGGCGSGTLGNLAENRALAKTAAQEIVHRLQQRSRRAGLAGIRQLHSAATSFDDWTSIDRAETLRARPNRLRTKFTSWSAMSEVIAEHRRTAAAHCPTKAGPDH
jgi:ferredoxin--NADP+ reductase